MKRMLFAIVVTLIILTLPLQPECSIFSQVDMLAKVMETAGADLEEIRLHYWVELPPTCEKENIVLKAASAVGLKPAVSDLVALPGGIAYSGYLGSVFIRVAASGNSLQVAALQKQAGREICRLYHNLEEKLLPVTAGVKGVLACSLSGHLTSSLTRTDAETLLDKLVREMDGLPLAVVSQPGFVSLSGYSPRFERLQNGSSVNIDLAVSRYNRTEGGKLYLGTPAVVFCY